MKALNFSLSHLLLAIIHTSAKIDNMLLPRTSWLVCCLLSFSGVVHGQTLRDGFRLHDGAFQILTLDLQTNGGILVGGGWRDFGDTQAAARLARMDPGGMIDTRFVSPFAAVQNTAVNAIRVQPDGRVLVGSQKGLIWPNDPYNARYCLRLSQSWAEDLAFSYGNDGSTTWVQPQVICLQPDGSFWTGGANGIRRSRFDGTFDSYWPCNDNGNILAIAREAGGAVWVGGSFTALEGVPRKGLARIRTDNGIDSTSLSQLDNGVVYALEMQGDGKLLVGGTFTSLGGQPRSYLARVNADGTVDSGFAPVLTGEVYAIKAQPDGRILIGGAFSQVNGISQRWLARLLADGTLDTGFRPMAYEYVYAIQLQPDGCILAGGSFGDGYDATFLGRLDPQGRLDQWTNNPPQGRVNTLALQPDGGVIIGGSFTHAGLSSDSPPMLARLQPDGGVDMSFQVAVSGEVLCSGVDSEGGVIFGGLFTQVNGLPRAHLARVNAAGGLDPAFNPVLDASPRALALLPDGSWLLGGDFTLCNGQACGNVAHLQPDGSNSSGFSATLNGPVSDLSVGPDGQWFAAGSFSQANGIARAGIARFSPSGALASSFSAIPNGLVRTVYALEGGGCLLGGDFTQINGLTCAGLARLLSDGRLDTTFSPAQVLRVYDITVRQDGVVEVVGEASDISGQATDAKVLLLKPDGSLLMELMPETIPSEYDDSSGSVTTMLTDTHGKLIVGGLFQETYLNRTQSLDEQRNLVRCSPPPDTHHRLGISRSGRVLTWTRTGGLARLENVTFAAARPGGAWQALGAGTRLANGCDWAIGDLSLAPGLWQVRARGQTASGTASWHELCVWLTVRPETTDFDLWLDARFGLGAGDAANCIATGQNAAGVSHLQAYAAGASGMGDTASPAAVLPQGISLPSGATGARFAGSLARADLALTLQCAPDLSGPWTNLASSQGGSAFSTVSETAAVSAEVINGQPMITVTENSAGAGRRFYRLLIALLNP